MQHIRLSNLLQHTSKAVVLALLALGIIAAGVWAAADLSITQTVVDVDNDGVVEPGDILEYTLTAANNGADAALQVKIADTLERGLSLVPGSLRVSPLAMDDQFISVGNTVLAVGMSYNSGPAVRIAQSGGVLANDWDRDGTFSLTTGTFTTTRGGSVTINANGSFLYTPPAMSTYVNFPDDTFTYTLTNDGLTSVGSVKVVFEKLIFYVDADAPSGGSGTSTRPFNELGQVRMNSREGDIVYLFNAGKNYTGIILKDNQQWVGEGSALKVNLRGYEYTLAPAGVQPNFLCNSDCIRLAQENTIKGLHIATTSGSALFGSNISTPTLLENVSLVIGGIGNALMLENHTGSFTFASGTIVAGNTGTAVNMSGKGSLVVKDVQVLINGGSALHALAGANVTFEEQLTVFNGVGTAVAILNAGVTPRPTVNFQSGLNLTTTNGSGLVVENAVLNIGGSDNKISVSNGAAANLKDVNLGSSGASFTTLSSSSSNTYGLVLNNVSGSFTASGGSLSGATSGAVFISGGKDNVTYGGSITSASASGTAVAISVRTGGTLTFSGNLEVTNGSGIKIANSSGGTAVFSHSSKALNTGTKAAVDLTNNNGFDITFSGGGLDIDTTSGTGILASGGSGSTLTISGTGNTLNATAGMAMDVNGYQSGGITFQSITAKNGRKGIHFTGSGSEFTVTGTGAADSGGVIENTDDDSIYLSGIQNVSLKWMRITAAGGHGIFLENITGTGSIQNVSVNNAKNDALRIVNQSGDLQYTIQNSTFHTTTWGSGIFINLPPGSSATGNFNVTGNTITNPYSSGFHLNNEGTGRAVLRFTSSNITGSGVGVNLSANGSGDIDFDIADNPTITSSGTAINLANNSQAAPGESRMNGFIRRNGQSGGVLKSTEAYAETMWVVSEGSGEITVEISNNIIAEYGSSGIHVKSRGGSGKVNATILNNQLLKANQAAYAGLYLSAGNGTAGETNELCLNVRSNQVNSTNALYADPYFIDRMPAPSANKIYLEGLLSNQTVSDGSNNTVGSTLLDPATLKNQAQAAPGRAYYVSPGTYFTTPGCQTPGVLPAAPALAAVDTALPAFVSFDGFGPAAPAVTAQVAAPAFNTHAAAQANPAGRGQPLAKMILNAAPVQWARELLAPAVDVTVPVLPAGKQVTVIFQAQVDSPFLANTDTVSSTASVSAAGISEITSAPLVTEVNADPMLALEVSAADSDDAGSDAQPGEVLTYTFQYQNLPAANQHAADLTLTFNLPEFAQFESTGSDAWDCSAEPTCVLAVATLDVGQSGTAVLRAKLQSAFPAGVENITSAEAVLEDAQNNAVASGTTTLSLDAAPDLFISKTSSPAEFTPAERLTYTLTYGNSGSQEATGVVITEIVPAGTTFSAADSDPGWTCIANICSLAVGNLDTNPVKDNPTFAVMVDAGQIDDLSNAISITDDQTNGSEADLFNNSFTLITEVANRPPELTITPPSVTQVNEGEEFSLVIGFSDPDGDLLDLTVDWGDGSAPETFSGLNPNGAEPYHTLTHTYLDEQVGAVITVTLSDGLLSGADTLTLDVLNVAPSFSSLTFSADDLFEGDSLELSGSVEDPGLNDTLTLEVNWGDHSAETYPGFSLGGGFLMSHMYMDDDPDDIYTVTLTLSDEDGGVTIETREITVSNLAPVIDPNVTLTAASEGQASTLTFDISDPSAEDTLTYAVDWGDGSAVVPTLAAGISVIETHIYADSGTYTFEITLQDEDGGEDTYSAEINIENTAPSLDMLETFLGSSPVTSVNEGDTLTLTGLYNDPGEGDLYDASAGIAAGSLEIDWGDGTTSPAVLDGTGAFSASHVYRDNLSGSLDATITAVLTDKDGDSAAADTTLAVQNVAPRVENLTTSPNPPVEGTAFTLSGEIVDPGLDDTFEMQITWEAGSVITLTGADLTHSGGKVTFQADYSYPNEGSYPVEIIVVDDEGDSQTFNQVIQVSNAAPVAGTLTAPESVEEGEAFTLSGSFSDAGLNDTHVVSIDWGDGSTDTLNTAAGTTTFEAAHTYADDDPSGTLADDYTIQVSVQDSAGEAEDFAPVSVAVNNVAPEFVGFSLPSEVNENTLVQWSTKVSDPGSNEQITFTIDWGDGSTDNAGPINHSPSIPYGTAHTYQNSGEFTVVSTVTDDDGGSATITRTITVKNVEPVFSGVSITPDVDEEGSVTLSGMLSDASPLDTYEMTVDWGDGQVDTFTYPASAAPFMFSETHVYTDDNPSGTASDAVEVKIAARNADSPADTWTEWDQPLAVMIFNRPPALSNLQAALKDDASGSAEIYEGDTVVLSGTITDAAADSFTLLVDWKDGSSPEAFTYSAGTTTIAEEHIYANNGSYEPVLTLTDDDTGQAQSTLAALVVLNAAPLVSDLTLEPGAVITENSTVTLTGKVTDPGKLDSLKVKVNWDASGSAIEELNLDLGATEFSLTHRYLDDNPSGTPADLKQISVELVDMDGGSSSQTVNLTVQNAAPVVSAGADLITAPGDAVTFGGSFTDAGTLDTHIIEWKLSSGETFSGDLKPRHVFTHEGTYTATLTVTDDDGGVGTDTVSIRVTPESDVALRQTVSAATILMGVDFDYIFHARNNGPSIAEDVVITATLPDAVRWVSGGAACKAVGQEVTCELGDLKAGEERAVTITVHAVSATSQAVESRSGIRSATPDDVSGNNQASVSVRIQRAAEVSNYDFEGSSGVPEEWQGCANRLDVTPTGSRGFLGQFANDTVCLSLDNLPAHTQVTVSFDLFIISSWDGTGPGTTTQAEEIAALGGERIHGPDQWYFTADGQEILRTTFSNWPQYGFRQAYPGPYPAGDFPSQTGAVERSTLGYEYIGGNKVNFGPMDSVYRISRTFDHTQADLLLEFAAEGLQGLEDESWGMDNVMVTLATKESNYTLYLPVIGK